MAWFVLIQHIFLFIQYPINRESERASEIIATIIMKVHKNVERWALLLLRSIPAAAAVCVYVFSFFLTPDTHSLSLLRCMNTFLFLHPMSVMCVCRVVLCHTAKDSFFKERERARNILRKETINDWIKPRGARTQTLAHTQDLRKYRMWESEGEKV